MNIRKITLFSGHVIQCFDNTLYGFFAVMLAPIYFPTGSSEHISLLGSYGAFAAGLLASPLGALFFGLWGDRNGRRKTLLYSMALIGFPTVIIGLLPGYKVLGMTATILLVVCRLLQGFFIGGGFTGVNLSISENGAAKTLGRQTGLLIAIGSLGAVLATILGAFFSMEIMSAWAWRIPFVFGGLSALGVYFLRVHFQETEDFLKLQQAQKVLKNPWKELLTFHKKALLLSSVIAGLTIMPLYNATIFGNQIFKEMGLTTSQSLSLNTLSLMIGVIMIPFFGRMADKIGFQNHMLLGSSLVMLVSVPAFMFISQATIHTKDVLIFVILMSVFGGIINGCAMPYMANLFPTTCRYSGLAISVTVGHALLGGTTPLISVFLRSSFHSNLAPGVWVCFVAFIAFTGVAMVPIKGRRFSYC